MRCPACGNRVTADAVYCQQCGSRVALAAPDHEYPEPSRDGYRDGVALGKERLEERRSRLFGRNDQQTRRTRFGSSADYLDEEALVWTGTFSWKGMIHEFLLASLATVALVVAAFTLFQGENVWSAITMFLGATWLLLFSVLIYRKLNFHYKVTDQRLIHETGILVRVLDRTEMIDVDDVRVQQDIIERIVNVGKIRLRTSDRSHPSILFRGIDHARDVADLIDDARRRERMRRGVHVETV